MAEVRLSDVIIPEVYESYQAVDSVEKTAIFESGIITQNALLNQTANSGGNLVTIPFWKDLANDEPNVGTDDPSVLAVPKAITTGEQIARVAYLNQAWSAMDLAGELAGSDPMQRIASRTSAYWNRFFQRRLLSSAYGILLDNVANDSSDMVYNIASESIAGQSASTKFSRSAFVEAVMTAGDAFANVGAIAVHSTVYKTMLNNNDIDFIPDSQGNMTIPTYLGHRVIVDDGATVVAGTTDGQKYVSIIFGAGAFGYGVGSPRVPVEIERSALAGRGSGVETLVERKTWIIHPSGFKINSTPAGLSHTNAELATAAAWDRVVERKNVGLAYLITN